MVEIICMVIDEKIDAVIHLTDWLDKAGKMDSSVLSREANVHNIPIATEVKSAEMFVDLWIEHLKKGNNPFQAYRNSKKVSVTQKEPLQDITINHRVLALIAHDGKKIEICQFAVQHADEILNKYDYILATGTTGTYIKQFMDAKGQGYGKKADQKIRCCKSGPVGGDLQIAHAVVQGLCQDIIFFQDPGASHPHDSDIRLLEQATLSEGVHARLATNQSTAKMLISYIEKPNSP
jgi:methylglyoxal synthase